MSKNVFSKTGFSFFFWFSMAIFLITPVYASGWLTNAEGNKVFLGDDLPHKSFIWDGSYKDGYVDGSGVLELFGENSESATRYVGTFVMGKISGKGKFVRPGVDGYFGSSKLDMAYVEYEGEFKDGFMHGSGSMHWGNGGDFIGTWVDGKRSGNGIYTFMGSNRFEGYWYSDDQAKGSGNFGANRYEGDWNAGSSKGQLPSGESILKGWYLAASGEGTIYYNNGDQYKGTWKCSVDGLRILADGYGIYYYKSGARYEGPLSQGKMNGQGIYYFENGDKYSGDFKDGNFEGQGIYYYKTGAIYKGEYKDDKAEGIGIHYFTNGDVYRGEFGHGRFHGYGEYLRNGAILYMGLWFDDEHFDGTGQQWLDRDRREHPSNPRTRPLL